ncbi:hypothetical protein [Celeribacter sp.]|uniref:hypothetical protein n=1 Tax=Celeribacter sp. TaxID=1890673 RepID=UPI003A93E6DF
MQQVGGAIGVAVIAILFSQILSNAGYANAFAGSLIYNILALMLAAIGIVWLTRRRSRVGIHP